jgi:hypothetical protein
MSLKIVIDVNKLKKDIKDWTSDKEADLLAEVENISEKTQDYIIKLAGMELHSTLKMFLDNLDLEQTAPGVHVISVDEDALFIEEGHKERPFDMKPGLLNTVKEGAKQPKTIKHGPNAGLKYRIIPFDQMKSPSNSTEKGRDLIKRIRKQLKKNNIPFAKLELDKNGSPRVSGKPLHVFNWGGEYPGKANTGDMQRVSIYQTLTKNGNVRRDIMTFRTVSAGSASKDKWINPGMSGKKFLDRAASWAMKEIELSMMPSLIRKWESK